MFPQDLSQFFLAHQEALWLTALLADLSFTILLYRLFGKAGLQVAIVLAILLANLQGPKLTVIFGFQTSLGVIFTPVFSSRPTFSAKISDNGPQKKRCAWGLWSALLLS